MSFKIRIYQLNKSFLSHCFIEFMSFKIGIYQLNKSFLSHCFITTKKNEVNIEGQNGLRFL